MDGRIYTRTIISAKVQDTGWVSPTGTFYACGPYQHDLLAEALHPGGQKALLRSTAWCRVSEGLTSTPDAQLNEAQVSTLLHLYSLKNRT